MTLLNGGGLSVALCLGMWTAGSCTDTDHVFRGHVYSGWLGSWGSGWRPLQPVLGTLPGTWPSSAFAQHLMTLSELPFCPLSSGRRTKWAVRGTNRDPLSKESCRLTSLLTMRASIPPVPMWLALSLPNSRHDSQRASGFSKLALIAEESRKRCRGKT